MSHTTDQLEGFEDLLAATGRVFLHNTEQFRGLVKRLQPDTEEYDLTPTDDDTILLSALRSEIPAAAVKVGASLSDADGFSYRVTRIQRTPNSLIARVECAVLNP
ncbi:MAG: hypothetical protein ACP5I4_14525 [Oceanipulchritudo sp.]